MQPRQLGCDLQLQPACILPLHRIYSEFMLQPTCSSAQAGAFVIWLTLSSLLPAFDTAAVEGRVLDASGAAVAGATISLALKSTGTELVAKSAPDGSFQFPSTGPGSYALSVEALGFTRETRSLRVGEQPVRVPDIRLRPATLAQEVVVHANELVGPESAMREIPGSIGVIDAAELTQSRVFNTDEALRKVTGVYTRPEEGFGLRPNIGIRGLNPTRSTKVLLLEDGVPISYAPYGDNASYYHPPVDRFDTIEVVKGSGQVLYGPSTVGGVINYLTPAPPDRSSGFVTLTGGNLDYFNGHVRYGTTVGRTGLLLDYMRKQGDGARANTHFGVHDVTGKVLFNPVARQTLSVKGNWYKEDSQLTYSGLRLAEWQQDPRQNPFRNDDVDFARKGGSLTHTLVLASDAVLTSNVYGQRFERDWWRQSSNSAQRPNDAADPLCGGMANLSTTCGNEGRLRKYTTFGFEPRLRLGHSLFGARNEVDLGFRGHFETQDRQQKNGPLPTSRDGAIVENNLREADAWSTFIQDRIVLGKFGITPGVRLEHVRYTRENRLLNVRGRVDFTQVIPGLGLSYSPTQRITFFAGAHRGFAPPRTEDLINNTTGGAVDLDPELSWNYEAGVRARVDRMATFEATFFRMDFENQIIPASVAGGIGATLTSAGETVQQGFELSGRTDYRNVLGSRHSLWLRGAWTWVPMAEFASVRFSGVSGFGTTRVTGNRVPYTPEHLLNAALGYAHSTGVNASVESFTTGGHFSDDLNSRNSTPDGQRGYIPSATTFNATVNYPVEQWHTTFFVAAKNITDRLFLVDRSRGMLPSMPRLVQIGLRFSF
jgi:Fe(3+) dicitrate transport protein